MAILLILGWVLGVFVWKHEGKVIHLLAVLAVISFVLALTRKSEKDIAN